jgi:hypothetical protein
MMMIIYDHHIFIVQAIGGYICPRYVVQVKLSEDYQIGNYSTTTQCREK